MSARHGLEEIVDEARRLGVTDAGLALLRHVHTTDRHRVVRASPFNGTTSFPSRKCGRMLYGESILLEGPWFRTWDADDVTLSIVDQPDAPVSGSWPAEGDRGRPIPVTLRPDAFLVQLDFAGWVDMMLES